MQEARQVEGADDAKRDAGHETDRSFVFRDREVVLEWPYFFQAEGRTYDVSGDGQRFLAIKVGAGAGAGAGEDETLGRAILVQNWFEELRQRVGN